MKAKRFYSTLRVSCLFLAAMLLVLPERESLAADKVNMIYTARVMSQAYPWFAQEAGLFKKYDLDVPLVFVTPGAPSVAAILSGDSEIAIIGAASITRPFVQGNKDPVFIGGIKSLLTHSIIAKPDIKRPEQLKGKRIGVSRIGSNPHYFAVQALRHFGIESREVSYIQAGGAPETLAALVAQGIDAAVLTVPTDAQALKLGYHYVVYGPDLGSPTPRRRSRRAARSSPSAARSSAASCAPWRRPRRSCTRTKNTCTRSWRISPRRRPQTFGSEFQRGEQSAGAETGDKTRRHPIDARRDRADRAAREGGQAARDDRYTLSRRDGKKRLHGAALERKEVSGSWGDCALCSSSFAKEPYLFRLSFEHCVSNK